MSQPVPQYDDVGDDRSSRVPTYAMVGRSNPAEKQQSVPLEALIEAMQPPNHAVTLTAERAEIVKLTSSQYLSVAEISAHMGIPVGVVQLLVADLLALQCVVLLTDKQSQGATNGVTMDLLESVLNGISAL